jgi:hypothetical protein
MASHAYVKVMSCTAKPSQGTRFTTKVTLFQSWKVFRISKNALLEAGIPSATLRFLGHASTMREDRYYIDIDLLAHVLDEVLIISVCTHRNVYP